MQLLEGKQYMPPAQYSKYIAGICRRSRMCSGTWHFLVWLSTSFSSPMSSAFLTASTITGYSGPLSVQCWSTVSEWKCNNQLYDKVGYYQLWLIKVERVMSNLQAIVNEGNYHAYKC